MGGPRRVAGCVAVRKGDESAVPRGARPSDAYQVMVVQSNYYPEVWLFPKGGIKQKKGEKPKEAAAREAKEEAGVEGRTACKLGEWMAWNGEQHIMFLMFVETQHTVHSKEWEERKERPRQWLAMDAAATVLGNVASQRPELLQMLVKAREKLDKMERKRAKKGDKKARKAGEKQAAGKVGAESNGGGDGGETTSSSSTGADTSEADNDEDEGDDEEDEDEAEDEAQRAEQARGVGPNRYDNDDDNNGDSDDVPSASAATATMAAAAADKYAHA